MALLTCQSCARHVKIGSQVCPFCGGAKLSGTSSVRTRVSRAAIVAGAASVAVAGAASLAACSAYGTPYPYYPDTGVNDASPEAAVKDSSVPDASPLDSSIPDSSKD